MSRQMDSAARQLMRALRGPRSQAMFSRRLGFASNVAAKWESGQRMPSATQAFSYSQRLGVDVAAVLTRFQPNVELQLDPRSALPDVAAWLSALRGAQRLTDIARSSTLSRYSVSRVLSGHSQPRLPQFLALVDALTQRADELIDLWVGIEQVPAVEGRFRRMKAAREAINERPVCLAVMCLLDTQALRRKPRSEQHAELSRVLELPNSEVDECLRLLSDGGVIAEQEGRYQPVGALTVDARTNRAREQAVKGYWANVAAERALEPRHNDVCSYNVFSISHEDYGRLRGLQRDFYRGARALIAASEPTELAGLLMVQIVAWEAQEAPKAECP